MKFKNIILLCTFFVNTKIIIHQDTKVCNKIIDTSPIYSTKVCDICYPHKKIPGLTSHTFYISRKIEKLTFDERTNFASSSNKRIQETVDDFRNIKSSECEIRDFNNICIFFNNEKPSYFKYLINKKEIFPPKDNNIFNNSNNNNIINNNSDDSYSSILLLNNDNTSDSFKLTFSLLVTILSLIAYTLIYIFIFIKYVYKRKKFIKAS